MREKVHQTRLPGPPRDDRGRYYSWLGETGTRFMSQRAKVLWVIALAIFPLVALSGFTIWQQYLRDEGMVSAERTYFAQATALAAEHFLDGQVAAARGSSDAADKPLVGPAKIVDGKPAVLITVPGGRVVPVPTERFAQGLMQKISSPLL